MLKRIWDDILVYLLWAVVLGVGIWLLLLSRNAVLSVFSILSTDFTTTRQGKLETLDKFYVISAGLTWLALMVLTEFYFRNGARRGDLFYRFARILGLELGLLFIVDGVLLLILGLSAATWLRWLILAAELGLAVACLLFARPAPSPLSDIRRGEEA